MDCGDVFTMVPFSDWQQRKENKTIDGADKEILAEAERLDVKAMGPLILSELLFNENIRDQIKKYKRHFLRVSLRQRVVNDSFNDVEEPDAVFF